MAKKKKKSKGKGQKAAPSNKSSNLPNLVSDTVMTRQVMGAEFDPSYDDLGKLEDMIANGVNKDLEKIKVLFVSEASFLHTGFSTYANNVLMRLHENPRIECAELGSYGKASDPRAHSIPWKFYSNVPETQQEEQAFQANYQKLQFGLFKYEEVMRDFQPDIILLHRDWWMDEGLVNHPITKKSHVIWMACVDSYPQKWEWMKSFQEVDTLIGYAHFGRKVIEDQSRERLAGLNNIQPMDVKMVAQAGVNPEEFYPLDKAEVRKKYNIDPSAKIIGTVMRNQPRKLFPRIMDSFSDFMSQHPDTAANTFLLLHTGIPDVGFDIPESMFRAGIEHRTLFSIKCSSCQENFVEHWGFHTRACRSCGAKTLVTPNTANGLNNEKFNEVYNLMDLYVQGSIAGADEMPATEAKACGIPVTCTDYAAMYEKNRNGGGLPIRVETMYTEAETMQNRAMFCRKSLTENMEKVLSSDFTQKRLSAEARQTVLDHYNWDLTAKKWEAAIMDADLKGRKVWERKTIACLIDASGATDEQVDMTINSISPLVDRVVVFEGGGDRTFGGIGLIASSFNEAQESVDEDWVLRLYAGEEVQGEPKTLSSEADTHWDLEGNIQLMTLEENEGGIRMDKSLIEPRFGPVAYKEGDKTAMIVTSSQKAAGILTQYESFLDQLEKHKQDGNEEEFEKMREGFKHFYQHLGALVDQDVKTIFHIIKRRAK